MTVVHHAHAVASRRSAPSGLQVLWSCARTKVEGFLISQDVVSRYYDPATGQFLSVDPQLQVTATPYVYASNNPVSNLDPNGEFTCGLYDWGIAWRSIGSGWYWIAYDAAGGCLGLFPGEAGLTAVLHFEVSRTVCYHYNICITGTIDSILGSAEDSAIGAYAFVMSTGAVVGHSGSYHVAANADFILPDDYSWNRITGNCSIEEPTVASCEDEGADVDVHGGTGSQSGAWTN